MDAPAFDKARLVRPALLSIVLYLLTFLIASMSMTNLAHASGTVTPTSGWCSNIYATSTCIYATELEACAKLASMQTECKYSPHIVHYKGSEITGDACFTSDSTGAVCFPAWSGLGWMGMGSVCPPNSTDTPTTNPSACTCNDKYQPDPSGQRCVPVSECSIKPLKDLPSDDACAQSLEAGHGVDVRGECQSLDKRLTGNDGQLQCFANKIAAINVTANPTIPYSGPTATIRNPAYQAHLQDVWDTMIKLNNLSDPAKINACKLLRDNVIAEKGCDSSDSCGDKCTPGSHCLDYRPPDSTNHSAGTSFDVSRSTINGLLSELTPLPHTPMTALQKLQIQRTVIADWLASPTACNLFWGGNWLHPDYVHFQLR
ncbi:MAG: hypothetical protein WCA64_05180 [Gallionella sp.]